MQFGLFGSAQARRGGPNDDSGAGFRDFVERTIEAEALGYYSTFLVLQRRFLNLVRFDRTSLRGPRQGHNSCRARPFLYANGSRSGALDK